MNKVIEDIEMMRIGEVLPNANLKDYTTYKIDGIASCIVYPTGLEQFISLLKYLRSNQVKHKILGRGSNLIFCNDNYTGILIKLDHFDDLDIKGNIITVGAGYPLIKLAIKLSRMGYTGLEFATGIPGSFGGAIFMNAGAYKSDMGYIVKSVKVLTPDYKVIEMTNSEMQFHYRTSFLHAHSDYICLGATLVLDRGNENEIMQLIEDRKIRRIETQPLEYPSAGSVFRNPQGDFAGRLVEEIGYKNYQIGGAMVSDKHANFIINKGDAKGSDIKKLIFEIKNKVKDEYGIDLIIEQEMVE